MKIESSDEEVFSVFPQEPGENESIELEDRDNHERTTLNRLLWNQ